jgi:hypothetical protein
MSVQSAPSLLSWHSVTVRLLGLVANSLPVLLKKSTPVVVPASTGLSVPLFLSVLVTLVCCIFGIARTPMFSYCGAGSHLRVFKLHSGNASSYTSSRADHGTPVARIVHSCGCTTSCIFFPRFTPADRRIIRSGVSPVDCRLSILAHSLLNQCRVPLSLLRDSFFSYLRWDSVPVYQSYCSPVSIGCRAN